MSRIRQELPTVALLAGVYAAWALATTTLATLSLPLAIVVATLATVLHSSLSHELIHGHPVRTPWVNALLAFPALSLFIPYLRFRDTHIAHHNDETLTDPYDDPESNFMDPEVWHRLPAWVRALLTFNNTLAGRMLVGPVIAQVMFMGSDLRAILGGDRRVLAGWLLHVPAVLVIVWWAAHVGTMPGWTYVLSAYLALSILKIRTYLEHQAHDDALGRTVVIEKRCPIAFLFLFNSLHIVHHRHPDVPWHRLPALYDRDRETYRRLNHGYVYSSYAEVFRRHFFKRKDPVPHPLWRPE